MRDIMQTASISVEIHQKRHILGEMSHNISLMTEALRNSDSRIIVFPEMFLTGYTLGRDIGDIALDIEDPIFESLKDEAVNRSKYLIFGFPERARKIRGQIHNSAMVLGPEGLIGVYRKIHLVDFGPFEEYAYFTPGNEPFMFSADGFRIGLTICYDVFFPELTKSYALRGADAVVCISASPSVTRKYFESVIRARSIESTVYLIYSNLVGFDSRMDFWGGSEMIGPRGNTIGKGPYFEESCISGEISEQEIRLSREGRPTLRDTRPHISEVLNSWK
jgi:predicted amidohydrolase